MRVVKSMHAFQRRISLWKSTQRAFRIGFGVQYVPSEPNILSITRTVGKTGSLLVKMRQRRHCSKSLLPQRRAKLMPWNNWRNQISEREASLIWFTADILSTVGLDETWPERVKSQKSKYWAIKNHCINGRLLYSDRMGLGSTKIVWKIFFFVKILTLRFARTGLHGICETTDDIESSQWCCNLPRVMLQ